MGVEVKIRGPLSEKRYLELLAFLKKKGKPLKEADQLAIFFQVPRDSLSLRRDHSEEKLVLKIGQWQEGNRREIEVSLKRNQFDNALNLLKGLGFTKGYRAPAFRQDFLYKGVRISLKTKAIIGPHFEMESVVENPEDAARQKERLLRLAKDLHLRVWSERGYREHTHWRWEAHHPGPEIL